MTDDEEVEFTTPAVSPADSALPVEEGDYETRDPEADDVPDEDEDDE